MSAGSFQSLVWPYVTQVAAATGLSPCLFLCQWADETGFGSCTNCSKSCCNNWAGICSDCYGCPNFGQGQYCTYPGGLQGFTEGYIAYIKGSGHYGSVLATAGQSLHAQMVALGESPWAGSHYNNGGGPGSSLWTIWQDNYANSGLNCGASSSSPPPPPPPPPGGTGTAGHGGVAPSQAIAFLLIAGGGAALIGWELSQNPGLRRRVERDIGTVADRGVRWVTQG